ncbi:MAG: short chain dehydrogenase [Rhodospirillaceae bacterium]|nr:short chain dehydrogenase [Rhodospirillaceae bacterium]|tara:strand:+ start:2229 stop:2975 length:747 start_codon:yes stop_codon:yes gene_type:complete
MTKTVLITGGAKRIGKAIAIDFAKKKWNIAIHYNESKDEAEKLAKEINDKGLNAFSFQADLSIGEESKKLIYDVVNKIGNINCLINNASIFERDEVNNISIESWDSHINSNLRSPVLLTKYFEKQLPQALNGNIINIVDQRVWNLTPHFVSYTLSKTGLWNFTQISALALAPRIRVNAIGPGPILPSSRQTLEEFKKQSMSTPLEKASTVEEICKAIQFIISVEGMTGQMIALDGGAHLSWKYEDFKE